FSSRRRHTRFSRDWSSDVCSSDLTLKSRLKRNNLYFVAISCKKCFIVHFSYLEMTVLYLFVYYQFFMGKVSIMSYANKVHTISKIGSINGFYFCIAVC